jgi:acetyl-CoA C-acetyltransferase
MPNYPVIVGAAQVTNRLASAAEAVEPAEMMAQVAREAAADAGAPALLERADSVQVVNMISWGYTDPPGTLAERIGANPSHKLYTAVGGETPQRLINDTATEIAAGRVGIALLAGCEAMASRRLARKEGVRFDWPRGNPRAIEGDMRMGFSDLEARHGATLPTRIYPLFENAIRAHLGHGIAEHQRHLGHLCERFSRVAAGNPHAWFPEARTAGEIAEPGPGNRWVCFPYPKLMNAIIEVDQAAAVILTGSDTARELGIPEEKWVYLRGCGQANDNWYVMDRVDYHSSPAIKAATSRALSMAGLDTDDIDFFDLYSCFPSAVQLALNALGLAADDPRDLTATGGLPYFGGPGNNYVMHSIASTVERLRANTGQRALVTGLGWFATKHSAGIYSTEPPTGDWQRTDPAVDQASVDAHPGPPVLDEADGEATVETYTVCYDREGDPETGIVIGRVGTGERFIANTPPDADLLRTMTEQESVGAKGRVAFDAATQRNIFSLS